MSEIPFIIIMMLVAIAAVIIIPAYLTNRAIVKVVKIFREHEADDIWSAKTAFQLGIGPRSFIERIRDPRRDYKPMALGTLIKFGIVRKTGNDRLYLSEKTLTEFCTKTENRLMACSLKMQKNR